MKSIDEYIKSNKYNDKQIEEIKNGINANIDISIYDNHIYHWSQMKQIREALERKKGEEENGKK